MPGRSDPLSEGAERVAMSIESESSPIAAGVAEGEFPNGADVASGGALLTDRLHCAAEDDSAVWYHRSPRNEFLKMPGSEPSVDLLEFCELPGDLGEPADEDAVLRLKHAILLAADLERLPE
eukprot:13333740-Heterocapsa_arctica.AAC.1